jgi:hypothetical protein
MRRRPDRGDQVVALENLRRSADRLNVAGIDLLVPENPTQIEMDKVRRRLNQAVAKHQGESLDLGVRRDLTTMRSALRVLLGQVAA